MKSAPLKLIAVFLCLGLCSCVTVTPEAEKVQLHRHVGTALKDCQKAGEVSGKGARGLSYGHSLDIAQAGLRHNAYMEFGADSVVLTSIEAYWYKIIVKGTAYKCKGTNL